VNVHAATGTAHHGFRHEGSSLTVGCRHIPNRVLHNLRPVGTLNQRIKAGTDFALTGTDFMVLHFGGNALLFHQKAHFRAHVLERINGRHREVAALVTRAMREVTLFVFDLRGPTGFIRPDLKERVFGIVTPHDGIENMKFRFWSEESFVTNTG